MVNRVAASTSFEILNDDISTVYELYRQIQAGTVSRKLLGQTFNYYDGEAFVGLPFGKLGDFGALVRSESLVLLAGYTFADGSDHCARGYFAQAARGALGRPGPRGYVRRPSGDVVQEPEEAAQAVIALIFDPFARVGTIQAVLR